MGLSETDDSRQKVEDRITEFKNPGFNAADQVEVFKKLLELNKNAPLSDSELMETAGRRIEFPHSWFAGSCSYGLPLEVSGNNLGGILKQGWTSRLENS